MNGLTEIVGDAIRVLEEMKREGTTHLAVSARTLAELSTPPAEAWHQPAQRPTRQSGPVTMMVAETSAVMADTPVRAVENRTIDLPRRAEAAPAQLADLEKSVLNCTKCHELSRCRHHVVFGVGSAQADLMFIGEAPGHDEDVQGEPFVGKAGQLLTKIIEAMGLSRGEVYICNVLKCRPPENRVPLPDEVHNCLPYLLSQIELIKPKVIVGLGATAMRALLDVQLGITRMRGHWYTFRGVPIMPTFHPAYLLRNPAAKREVWDDMQEVVTKLGRKIPESSRKISRS